MDADKPSYHTRWIFFILSFRLRKSLQVTGNIFTWKCETQKSSKATLSHSKVERKFHIFSSFSLHQDPYSAYSTRELRTSSNVSRLPNIDSAIVFLGLRVHTTKLSSINAESIPSGVNKHMILYFASSQQYKLSLWFNIPFIIFEFNSQFLQCFYIVQWSLMIKPKQTHRILLKS